MADIFFLPLVALGAAVKGRECQLCFEAASAGSSSPAGAANPASTKSSCSSSRISLKPQVQFLQAFLVLLTSQSSLLTKVGRSKSASVSRVDSSMVGVEVPELEAEVVKAQREALAAREVRRGRATEPVEGAGELSMEEAGRFLKERGTEVTLGLVEVSCKVRGWSVRGRERWLTPLYSQCCPP